MAKSFTEAKMRPTESFTTKLLAYFGHKSKEYSSTKYKTPYIYNTAVCTYNPGVKKREKHDKDATGKRLWLNRFELCHKAFKLWTTEHRKSAEGKRGSKETT